jgi:hypothetical protein
MQSTSRATGTWMANWSIWFNSFDFCANQMSKDKNGHQLSEIPTLAVFWEENELFCNSERSPHPVIIHVSP